ncbi:polysaccharide deacetylase family protein [Flavisericum labens]|uniref:polysaccharide deacetylase family protein n=1 Tax=Flavisericum labens TaxID=3377112 RepID=UPI00387B14C6
MKKSIVLVFGLFFVTLFSCSKDKNTYVNKQKFNKEWCFVKLDDSVSETGFHEKDFDDSMWAKVTLPHTPQLEPKIVNNQWQGICWYRKSFNLSNGFLGKQLFLKFEGAMNITEVWVNGKKLIEHHGGYLPFIVNFTNVANFDKENIVAVRLNNQDNPVTGPKPLKILDFNTYGGIYRNVWLIAKNSLHITDPVGANKTASGGVFVTYPEVSEKAAKVKVKTHVKNANDNAVSFTVKNTLLKGNNVIITELSNEQKLEIDNDKEVVVEIQVENPELWSPKFPNLYILKTEIIQDGALIDQEITRIGIKSMKFVGQDFYLNGEKTFLRGVNRHQEYPHVGYAISDNANYRDAKKIKDAGFDYVRLSHYPHAPAFMDACDELGLITIDAILGWQYFSEDEKFQKHVFQTARDLIRRDRNHASVLAWEVSLNESWMPEYFIDSLTTIAKQEYPSSQCFTAGWQSYGYDIYLQARQHRLDHYDENLKKPYNVSEYGDWEYYAMNAGLDQTSWSNLLQEERSSRQLRGAGEKALLQQATNLQEAHNDNLSTPAFADGYWVMYDYNRGYADDLEASGIMDVFRLPKLSYYFYKSQRNAEDPFGEPMVYIANNWQKDSSLDVRIFSNCDEVELFLNGRSLGRQKPDQNRISTNLKHPPFTFILDDFQEGKLEAKGYISGKLVVADVRQTPGKPSKIEIVIDNEYDNLKIEDNDLFFVHAYVTDKNGTVIPNYSGEVTFNVEGNVEIIGENPTNCSAGIASILVKTSENIDDIKITASSKNLVISPDNIIASINVPDEITIDSLPLIPKHFLEHQKRSKGYCMVNGDSSKKQVALTFDDGPTDLSLKVIKTLNKHNAKGTFFWLGKNLQEKKGVIKEAKQGGHLIANHSWNHQNGFELSKEDLWQNQVLKSMDAFKLCGTDKPKYYRPPYGAISQDQIDFLAKKGITTVLWSITTIDWDKTQNSEDELFEKFKNYLHNGAIVLLHDFDFGNSIAKLKALDKMITYGKSIGFNFVNVEDI